MRLAVSNIAWRSEESEAALGHLQALGVQGLEIAAGLAFFGEPDPMRPGPAAVDRFRANMSRKGLTIASMQSLLFGRTEAALFGDSRQRGSFEAGVAAAIDLAGRLDCRNLVLGSPTARCIPDGLDPELATRVAQDVIGRLGDRCSAVGTILSLEPNPATYGTNFLNTFAETAGFVRTLGHSAVRVNLDLGALTINGETDAVVASLPTVAHLIGHVHISEPHLTPAPADVDDLAFVLVALGRQHYQGWVSIEMRSREGDNLHVLADSVTKAQAAIRLSENAHR